MEDEKYDDSFSQEFKDKAKEMNISIPQLEFLYLVCETCKKETNKNCIYLQFNLCTKLHN